MITFVAEYRESKAKGCLAAAEAMLITMPFFFSAIIGKIILVIWKEANKDVY